MDNNKTVENGEVKIVEPNRGRHIAVASDINTIVASKEDTGRTYSLSKQRFFQEEVLLHIFKHVNMKGFTLLKDS